jgi:hypothetical protein
MKKIIVFVLLASISFVACKKAPCPAYTKTLGEENLLK